MNLREEIRRNRKLMGLKEQKPIYNLDLLELGGSMEDLIKMKQEKHQKKFEDDKLDLDLIDKAEDFSESLVQDVVWRVGQLNLNYDAGGLWFGDSKHGVENFAKTVRRHKPERQAVPYYINLKNPYVYNHFWNGYITDIENKDFDRSYDGRYHVMIKLMREGYDGIIIENDKWNDTGDPDTEVYGKQYVVFDPKDVKPA